MSGAFWLSEDQFAWLAPLLPNDTRGESASSATSSNADSPLPASYGLWGRSAVRSGSDWMAAIAVTSPRRSALGQAADVCSWRLDDVVWQ